MAIVNAVISLSTHVQQLGFLLDSMRIGQRATRLLDAFASQFLGLLQDLVILACRGSSDVVKDLAFLHILASAWETQLSDMETRLRQTAISIVDEVSVGHFAAMKTFIDGNSLSLVPYAPGW